MKLLALEQSWHYKNLFHKRSKAVERHHQDWKPRKIQTNKTLVYALRLKMRYMERHAILGRLTTLISQQFLTPTLYCVIDVHIDVEDFYSATKKKKWCFKFSTIFTEQKNLNIFNEQKKSEHQQNRGKKDLNSPLNFNSTHRKLTSSIFVQHVRFKKYAKSIDLVTNLQQVFNSEQVCKDFQTRSNWT